MLDKSFGLFFYLKKPKNYSEGPLPIYLRITVNGNVRELSAKRKWDPVHWNASAGRAIGKKEDVRSLNAYLDTLQANVYEAKRQLIEMKQDITPSAIKDLLFGTAADEKFLIQTFEDYNTKVKQLIGIDYAKNTWSKYDRTRRFAGDSIKWKYKAGDIAIHNLNLEFVQGFDFWLKTVRRCGQNATVKYISILRMVVLFCVDNNWLPRDPFALFKMKKQEVIPVFLTKEELQRIAEIDITIERMKQVRDVFLFCCYTGLSYVDISKLNTSEIVKAFDGRQWIITRRGKTNIASRIPLLPVTEKILAAYKDNPQCVTSGRLLPVLTNQKYNSYLKELADICGIQKKLTSHTARHTFATTVTLSNGVPIESVSKMLGHKKLQTTQHYARVLDMKVSEDMEALRRKLENDGAGERKGDE